VHSRLRLDGAAAAGSKAGSLLQDGDPPLAAAISSSKQAIWNILADPDKLAKI
jgi:hypothetical protein